MLQSGAGQKSVLETTSSGNFETHHMWGLPNFVTFGVIWNMVLCVKTLKNYEVLSTVFVPDGTQTLRLGN